MKVKTQEVLKMWHLRSDSLSRFRMNKSPRPCVLIDVYTAGPQKLEANTCMCHCVVGEQPSSARLLDYGTVCAQSTSIHIMA